MWAAAAGAVPAIEPAAPRDTFAPSHAVSRLSRAIPAQAADFTATNTRMVGALCEDVERWFEERTTPNEPRNQEPLLQQARVLVAAKGHVDRVLDQLFASRRLFADQPDGETVRSSIRNYLKTITNLIELSGTLRYLLRDALYDVAFAVAGQPERRGQLIEMLLAKRSSIGAAVMSDALFDPPEQSVNAAQPAGSDTKLRLLDLIAVSGQADLVPTLAEFLAEPNVPAELVVRAAEVLRRIGLPQDPRPAAARRPPRPLLTARRLRETLRALPAGQLREPWDRRRQSLIEWLDARVDGGIRGQRYPLGGNHVRPGDWLLMRNPSPYNRFTDLSPGLFTHVGVITVEVGSDGRRRMVVVDLPERGTRMQATNVEVFVQRTLHYVVLRHSDPGVARTMAQRAASAIGVATTFDLNFRTQRVFALRGQPLKDKTIHTYCAGLLLLCAQETGRDLRHFFPFFEYPAGGKTVANLAQLGLSFGRQFLSPTGALYSPHLTIVARRIPMYEPRREIEEAVYDHFVRRLRERDLDPAPDLLQSLRLKLVEAAQTNTLLARALAGAVGVDERTDLVAAAKAMAVIETLDAIARENSEAFAEAREAFWQPSVEQLAAQQYSPEAIDAIRSYRTRHQDLYVQWTAQQLSPRALRMALVRYYVHRGTRQLDERFFQPPAVPR